MTDYSPEEYSEYRLHRALETIKEVKTHIENEFWNTPAIWTAFCKDW